MHYGQIDKTICLTRCYAIMKHTILPVIAIAAALITLSSCKKDEVAVPEGTPDLTDTVVDTTTTTTPPDTSMVEDTTVTWSETVDTVIVSQYAGLWYEIATIPQIFQAGCNCTTAEYAAISETEISVTNRCNLFSTSGFENNIEGTATIVPNSGNAKLLVSFFGFGASDYWIIDLDDNYQWAVVGSGDKQSFWILSRTPSFDENLYNELITRWGSRGYDVSRVERTVQEGCW